jgi:hypothetical protein
MYVYHYHAMRQESMSCTHHLDGIIKRYHPITEWDHYQEIKEEINGDSRLKLTICSLALLSS